MVCDWEWGGGACDVRRNGGLCWIGTLHVVHAKGKLTSSSLSIPSYFTLFPFINLCTLHLLSLPINRPAKKKNIITSSRESFKKNLFCFQDSLLHYGEIKPSRFKSKSLKSQAFKGTIQSTKMFRVAEVLHGLEYRTDTWYSGNALLHEGAGLKLR